MNIPPIVALEVGTTRIRALVGEARDDGQLMVTGLGEVRSRGVRKSEIVDMDMAQSGVRKALEQAEKTGQVSVNQVHLVVSGGHLQGLVNRGSVPVIDGATLAPGHELAGPYLIEARTTTVFGLPGDWCQIGDGGDLLIELGPSERSRP